MRELFEQKQFLIMGLAAEIALPMAISPTPRNLFLVYINLRLNDDVPISGAQLAKLMNIDRATARDQLARIPEEHFHPDVEGYQLSAEGRKHTWRVMQRYHRLFRPSFGPHLFRFLRRHFKGREPLLRFTQFGAEVEKSFRLTGMLLIKAQILAVTASRPLSVGYTPDEMTRLVGFSYKRTYAILQEMLAEGELRREGHAYHLTGKGLRVALAQSIKVVAGLPKSELGFLTRYIAFSIAAPRY